MRRQSGTTTSIADLVAKGWREDPCPACAGTGWIGGRRMEAPLTLADYCPQCRGRGATWISPQGRRASYPGGPWMGR